MSMLDFHSNFKLTSDKPGRIYFLSTGHCLIELKSMNFRHF